MFCYSVFKGENVGKLFHPSWDDDGPSGRPVGIHFLTLTVAAPKLPSAPSLNVITAKSVRCFIGFSEAQQLFFFQSLVLCDLLHVFLSIWYIFLGSPLYNWLKLQTSVVPGSLEAKELG